MKITRRGTIRLCSLTLAAVAALSVRNIQLMRSNERVQRQLTGGYTRAVEELAGSCDKLSSVLEKQLYAGSGEMQQTLATDLYREASAAKAALSQLPVAELNLQNTYKFLSQVGNYSLALSKKLMNGEQLTNEEYKNISSLCEFSKGLAEDMWTLEGSVAGGELSLIEANDIASQEQPPMITEGFGDFEGNFDEYPKLIYDGPFSDNIMEQTPKMTEFAADISRQEALRKAAEAMNISPDELTEVYEVEGKMPAWRFSDRDNSVFCEVTKQGGYVSYFLSMKNADKRQLSNEEALKAAEDFLKGLGMEPMETTYYEVQNDIMTVNFCYSENGTRVYPDLAKVSVAMDDGSITGYDARGFLVNHTDRYYNADIISGGEAQKQVSPRLKVTGTRLALIPTDGLNEKLCYEFTCTAENGRNVLVYINAETSDEEQILILLESPNGTLAQ